MAALNALILAATAVAAGPAVPLQAGDYAAAGFTCATAPLAALMHYDGRNFSGAHDSHCSSTTREHHGADYLVSTTCTALGDGTPAAPSTVATRYRFLSPRRVIILPAKGDDGQTYSRCRKPVS